MAFYVGQRVVCVDASYALSAIREGSVYTVSAVLFEGVALLLVEVEAHPMVDAIRATRFRPITERKTSIEIFKAMLNPSKTEVEA